MFTDYIEFEISVEPPGGAGYPLAVRSPAGEARGTLRLPSGPAFQDQLARLAALDTDEALLNALGQALFDALVAGAVRELLLRSQSMLAAHQALRIKLCLPPDDAQLAALPWELLYDPNQGPLALLDAPIVRYLAQPTRLPMLKTNLPLRVLLTASSVEGARELAEVQAALADLAGHVQITVEPALTGPQLQQLLRPGFHIWHCVAQSVPGRDGKGGALALPGASGGSEPLGAAQLGILLNRSGLRLVVLDDIGARLAAPALQSFAAPLLRAQVGALLTLQFTNPAESARAFTGEFYRTLAAGFPIDACVTEGRKAVMGSSGLGRADWALPVVYTRAPDACLFELPPAADIPGAIVAEAAGGGQFSQVTINTFAGTLVQAGQRPTIERIAQRPRPPRPLRSFRDRASEQQALLPELAPGRGAWLRGPDGVGLSALLRQAANSAPAGALPDGVVYLGGDSEPDLPDDVVQRLFERFYTSDVAVRIAPASARSYLGELRALFLLDELRLNSDQLVVLADLLAGGTVLIAADGAAPDTLLDVAVQGLPRADAQALLAGEAQLDTPADALLEQIATALADLPMALLLVGRLLQRRLASPAQLAAVLADMADERDPLARAARLALVPLSPPEREVLATLAHIGGADAALDAIAAVSQTTPDAARGALDRLIDLRLVEAGGERYAIVSAGLRRVLARLLAPGEKQARAAAFFAKAASLHLGDTGWLIGEQANLQAAIRTSLVRGQPAQAGALAQALAPAATLSGQWGQWERLTAWARQAAEASGDRRLAAWALHEQGTRAGLLGHTSAAAQALTEAQRIRSALHDTLGAQASAQNLAYWAPPAPPPPEEPAVARRWLLPIALGVALLVGGLLLLPRLLAQPATPTAVPTPLPTALPPTATRQPPTASPTPQPPTPLPATRVPASSTPTPRPTATATPSALPTSTLTATPTELPLCRVVGAGISVRVGPGRVYPLIGRLARGDTFAPQARDPQGFWVQLQAPRLLGWVALLPDVVVCNFPTGDLPIGRIPPTPVPPTAVPPTAVPPTPVPPTAVLPTAAPPTDAPPTDTPPTDTPRPRPTRPPPPRPTSTPLI